MQKQTNNGNEYIQKALNEANERKKELLMEINTSQRSRRTEVYLKKLTGFPKVGFGENKKLHELGDLLLELQCAKTDGGCPGLKILDEPTYIKPVVAKLPNDIQDR